jgi:hypothetical protein
MLMPSVMPLLTAEYIVLSWKAIYLRTVAG